MNGATEQFAATRFNYERARAFSAPVLRSRHPDALLVGYSITGEDHPPVPRYDRIVEAGHVVTSTLESNRPVAFSTRSWKVGFDPDAEFLFHAIYDLTNSIPSRSVMPSSRESRRALHQTLQGLPRREARVLIDDEAHVGEEMEHLGSVFVRLPGFGGAEMVTIAAPREFVEAGFWSDVPE